MVVKGLIPHKVLKGQRSAFEQTGNWFYWTPLHPSSPIYSDAPQGISFNDIAQSHTAGTSISVYNDWPENAGNKSLFEYLRNPKQSAFATMISQYYQCACAIVYYDINNCSNIIGSGGRLDNGIVVTAKHLYAELPFDQLYARFFYYQVQEMGNRSKVCEYYIDVPILGAVDSGLGYDFGFLDVPLFENPFLNQMYLKGVQRYPNEEQAQLPDGQYITFHFADGIPQVSIGEVRQYSSQAGSLQNIIGLNAGPGASGAILLWANLDVSLSAIGISVYRQFKDDRVERRSISFATLGIPPSFNNLDAPYFQNPKFSVMELSTPREEDGYEFFRWFTGYYDKYGDSRPKHAESYHYNVQEGHSNHHIVQCIDLCWLYAYFNDYQVIDSDRPLDACCPPAIVRAIKQAHSNQVEISTNELKLEISQTVDMYYQNDQPIMARKQLWNTQYPVLQENLKIIYHQQLRAEVKKRYGPIQTIIDQLCIPFPPSKAAFVWGLWNLFKGPSSRNDDPKNRTIDRCEFTKPKSYDPTLWKLLTDKKDGLNAQIKLLKSSTDSEDDLKLQAVEKSVGRSLTNINQFWRKKYPNQQHMKSHEYQAEDWELSGHRNGEALYSIKL